MTSTSIVVYPRVQQTAPRYYDDSYLTLTRLSTDPEAEARPSRSNTRNSDRTYADPLVVVCQPGPRSSHERLSRSLPPLSIRGPSESRRRRSSTRQPSPAYVTTSNTVTIRQPVSVQYYEESDASLTTRDPSSRPRSHSRDPSPVVHTAHSNTVTIYRVSPAQPEKHSGSRLRPLSMNTTAESRRSSSTGSFHTSRGHTAIGGTTRSPWVRITIVAERAITNRYIVVPSRAATPIMLTTGVPFEKRERYYGDRYRSKTTTRCLSWVEFCT